MFANLLFFLFFVYLFGNKAKKKGDKSGESRVGIVANILMCV